MSPWKHKKEAKNMKANISDCLYRESHDQSHIDLFDYRPRNRAEPSLFCIFQHSKMIHFQV